MHVVKQDASPQLQIHFGCTVFEHLDILRTRLYFIWYRIHLSKMLTGEGNITLGLQQR
jgi:hypothetical protein